jgi:hypothetical protein
MTEWKDVLCLLAIFMAYGFSGHLDYQDAIAMEEAMREDTPPHCSAPSGAEAEGTPPLAADARVVRLGATAATSSPVCGPDKE